MVGKWLVCIEFKKIINVDDSCSITWRYAPFSKFWNSEHMFPCGNYKSEPYVLYYHLKISKNMVNLWIGQNFRATISQILEIILEIYWKVLFWVLNRGKRKFFFYFSCLNFQYSELWNFWTLLFFTYCNQSLVELMLILGSHKVSKHLWIIDSHNYLDGQIFSFDGTVVSFENFTPLRAIMASESSLISSPSPSRTITSKQLSWSRWICTEDFIRLE